MNITKDTFYNNQSIVLSAVEECDFMSIDCEMSGLSPQGAFKASPMDTLSSRYAQLCMSSRSFALLQYGLCCFNWQKDGTLVAKPFNFYIYPESTGRDDDRCFLFQCDSFRFLCSQGFNFNSWIRDGIPYSISNDAEKANGQDAPVQPKATAPAAPPPPQPSSDQSPKPNESDKAKANEERKKTEAELDGPAQQLVDSARRIVEAMIAADGPGSLRFPPTAQNLQQPPRPATAIEGEVAGNSDLTSVDIIHAYNLLDVVAASPPATDAKQQQQQHQLPCVVLTPMNGYQRRLLYRFFHDDDQCQAYVTTDNNDNKDLKKSGVFLRRPRLVFYPTAEAKAAAKAAEKNARAAESEQNRKRRDMGGFRAVIDAVTNSKKLVLAHNCALDLFHTWHKFRGQFPPTVDGFTSKVHAELFPRLLDTKVLVGALGQQIASYGAPAPASGPEGEGGKGSSSPTGKEAADLGSTSLTDLYFLLHGNNNNSNNGDNGNNGGKNNNSGSGGQEGAGQYAGLVDVRFAPGFDRYAPPAPPTPKPQTEASSEASGEKSELGQGQEAKEKEPKGQEQGQGQGQGQRERPPPSFQHEAGFDAYQTGVVFAYVYRMMRWDRIHAGKNSGDDSGGSSTNGSGSVLDLLYSRKPDGQGEGATSIEINPSTATATATATASFYDCLNRIHLMRMSDCTLLLPGPTPAPDRSMVLHVANFPYATKTYHIRNIFNKYVIKSDPDPPPASAPDQESATAASSSSTTASPAPAPAPATPPASPPTKRVVVLWQDDHNLFVVMPDQASTENALQAARDGSGGDAGTEPATNETVNEMAIQQLAVTPAVEYFEERSGGGGGGGGGGEDSSSSPRRKRVKVDGPNCSMA